MIKKLAYFAMITLFICCKSDNDTPDCSAVTCIVPHFMINMINDTTKENFIIQNSLSEGNITIQDASENQIKFSIIESNGFLFIEKKNQSGALEIFINSEIVANVSYNTSLPKTNECCDFGDLMNVIVEGKTFEVENNLITIYL